MKYTVAVTSGTRATAKTTSVSVLGAVFADAGADVLLVDCDLANPSLAAALDIAEPDVRLRDVFAGSATLDEAAHTCLAGVAVVPGGRFAVPTGEAIRDLVDLINGFDVVICDTGRLFSDATKGTCDAADGAVVVSTPGDAARQNAAAVYELLRQRRWPLLGTVVTRAKGDADSAGWDYDILATISESNAVADGSATVVDSPSDPGAESYRELARGVFRRLRGGHDEATSNSRLWLSHPADPFLTPSVPDGRTSASDTHSEDRIEEPDSDAGDNDTPSRTVLVTDGGSGSALDANDSAAEADTTPEEPDEHDGSEIKLTRRGALAAITAAVGGVSAGILNTRETPQIEAFGYGGSPVSSSDSENADATNGKTSAGTLPTTGINRTEPTNETGATESGEDLIGSDTDTGGNNDTSGLANTTNSTDTDEELSPETELEHEEGDTESSVTNGGGGRATEGDGSSEDGLEGGTGSGDDTTADSSEPSNEQFGSIGYGQGGYGGVV